MAENKIFLDICARLTESMSTVDRAVVGIHLYCISRGLLPASKTWIADWKHLTGYRILFKDLRNRDVEFDLTLSDRVNLSVHARTPTSDDLQHVVLHLKQLNGLPANDFCDKLKEQILPRFHKFILEPLETSGHLALHFPSFDDAFCRLAEGSYAATSSPENYIETFSQA